MPGKRVNITGTSGKTYDLDQLKNQNTRTSQSEELIVQIWEWNPNLPEGNPHKQPNPENLVIGQIWLSKYVAKGSDEYNALLELSEE